MDTVEWNGVTLAKTLKDYDVEARNALADAAKRHDWPRVIELLPSYANRINTSRLGGTALYAPFTRPPMPAPRIQPFCGPGRSSCEPGLHRHRKPSPARSAVMTNRASHRRQRTELDRPDGARNGSSRFVKRSVTRYNQFA